MKQATKLLLITLLSLLYTTSCKKDVSCENCNEEIKQPPIANAGSDKTFELPLDSTLLDGSASKDIDGTIKSWKWNKISGPVNFTIRNADADKTIVTGLEEGVYRFELIVTDNDNLTAKDTVQITVQKQTLINTNPCGAEREVINIQLQPFGKLSIPRDVQAIVNNGSKIFFAGGHMGMAIYTKRIDVYDDVTKQWSTTELSDFNTNGVAFVIGDKAIFEVSNDKLDIYSISSQSLTTIPMKNTRAYHTSTKLNNKIFFAGGSTNAGLDNRVDIYDVTTNQWTSAILSEARAHPAPVQVDNKLYLIGGIENNNSDGVPSNKVDIFDYNTNTWSATTINKAKTYFGGIHKNGKIIMAGGAYQLGGFWEGDPTCEVEIFDINTKQSTYAYLKQPALTGYPLQKNNLVIFPTSRLTQNRSPYEVEIYDTVTGKWLIGKINTAVIGYFFEFKNEIYMAGGEQAMGYSDQVYKLVF